MLSLIAALTVIQFADRAFGADANPIDHSPSYHSVSPAWLAPDWPLNNPGMGIEQAARLLTPSGVLNVNSDVESIATIRYIRVQWSLLEKDGDNEWNFAPLDQAIEDSVRDGKQAAIAVMGHVPKLGGRNNYTQAIPRWYMEAAEARGPRCVDVGDGSGVPRGCTHYRVDYRLACAKDESCANLWTFNHNDEGYIRQQIELIEALRARYDNPAWAGAIAYVDVRGGIGSWTEGHVDGVRLSGTETPWPMPSYANKVRIADAYLEFTQLPILANVRNGNRVDEAPVESQWVYLCQQAALRDRVLGWRTDGLDSTKYLIDAVFTAHPFMRECWQRGPVHGELNGIRLKDDSPVNGDPWAGGRTGYFALNQRLAQWHLSGWNTKYHPYPDDPARYGAALDEWRAIGGYRLGVVSAWLPSRVGAGVAFDARVDLGNSGTAPVYRRWYQLVLRFQPSQGGADILVPLAGEITKVLPQAEPLSFTASGQSIARAGDYAVSIGVVQDPTFDQVLPLKLAHAQEDCAIKDGTYWCGLGRLEVLDSGEADSALH